MQSLAAILGQLVALLLLPALSRLAPPAVLGGYAPYLSLTVIGSIIGLARLEQIVLIAREKSELLRLQGVIVLASLGGGGLVVFGAMATQDLGVIDALLAGTMYAVTLVNRVWMLVAIRTGRHGRLGIAHLVEVVGTIGLQVLILVLGSPGVTALLAGRVLALILASTVVLPSRMRTHRWRPGLDFLTLVRRHREVVSADLPGSVCNTLSWQGPILVIAAIWGDAGAGSYAMAYRLLRLPNRFLGDPIGRVFTSSLVSERNSQTLVKRYTALLVGIGLVIYVPLLIMPVSFLERILGTVLGPEWSDAAPMIRALAPWLGTAFALTHLGVVFLRTDGLRILLAFNLALLGSRAVAVIIGFMDGDLSVFLWALSLSGVLVYASLYPLATHSVNRQRQRLPRMESMQ